mgnify:CR=1 FL=1
MSRISALYRKKPVVVEAFQFLGESTLARDGDEWAAPGWFVDAVLEPSVWAYPDHIRIVTDEGTMTADIGDWIIRGVKGELYPCTNEVFEMTYEPAEPQQEEG